jgi:hypothetical protein
MPVLLETLFVCVWRCRSYFHNPKVLRFRANPFTDCVHLQKLSKRMKDSREESCPVRRRFVAPAWCEPPTLGIA